MNTDPRVPVRLLEDRGFCLSLTVEKVAKLLRVSRATLYGVIERGELPHVRLPSSLFASLEP